MASLRATPWSSGALSFRIHIFLCLSSGALQRQADFSASPAAASACKTNEIGLRRTPNSKFPCPRALRGTFTPLSVAGSNSDRRGAPVDELPKTLLKASFTLDFSSCKAHRWTDSMPGAPSDNGLVGVVDLRTSGLGLFSHGC